MTYDFFANKEDQIEILKFIFKETDLRIFDLSSLPEQEVNEYKNSEDIFKQGLGHEKLLTFQLWSPRFKGEILFRRIKLNPKSCNGHAFRYLSEGWGLIQLYFGVFKGYELFQSHIGHFNEKGALKKESLNPFYGKVDKWDWKEIQQTSRKLKYYIHNKLAVRRLGHLGILSGADILEKEGIKLR